MSIDYKVLPLVLRTLRRLKPGPASIHFETELPISIVELDRRLASLAAGPRSHLPGVTVTAEDAGVFRSRLIFAGTLPQAPGAALLLDRLRAPFIHAFRRKAHELLYPGLAPRRAPARTSVDYLVVVPLRGASVFNAPFAPQAVSDFVLCMHLTDPPIPFQESAAVFELYEKRTLITRQARYTGYAAIRGPRQTVLRKGAGARMIPVRSGLELTVFDETIPFVRKGIWRIEKPFGLGDALPDFARLMRRRFFFTDELDAVIADERLERPANLIEFLGSVPDFLIEFVSAAYGLNLTPADPAVLIPGMSTQTVSAKTLPAAQFIF